MSIIVDKFLEVPKDIQVHLMTRLLFYDGFITGIKAWTILDDHTFELLKRSGSKIVLVKCKGVWIGVDISYHNSGVSLYLHTQTHVNMTRLVGVHG